MGGGDCGSGHGDPANRRKGVMKDWGQGWAFCVEHGPFSTTVAFVFVVVVGQWRRHPCTGHGYMGGRIYGVTVWCTCGR